MYGGLCQHCWLNVSLLSWFVVIATKIYYGLTAKEMQVHSVYRGEIYKTSTQQDHEAIYLNVSTYKYSELTFLSSKFIHSLCNCTTVH